MRSIKRTSIIIAFTVVMKCTSGWPAEMPALCIDNTSATARDPRELFDDENTELLAVRLSSGYHADKRIYDRLVRDLKRIRASDARVAEIKYNPKQTNELYVGFTPEGAAAYNDDRYKQWDCLNGFLGVYSFLRQSNTAVKIAVGGRYKMQVIAQWYRALPGIETVGMEGYIGDGSNIYVVRKDGAWEYLIDIAGGDCMMGCTEHDVHYFEVAKDGHFISRKRHTSRGGRPLPNWASEMFGKYL